MSKLSDHKDELALQEAELDKQLEWLKQKGDYKQSSRNEMIAENKTMAEFGDYKKVPTNDKWPKDILDGVIVRGRSDVLTTKLNSKDILDLLENHHPKIPVS